MKDIVLSMLWWVQVYVIVSALMNFYEDPIRFTNFYLG